MTNPFDLIHKQMLRNRWRYGDWRERMMRDANISDATLEGLRRWFEDRHAILTVAYREAINADDSIIAGKQQLFDQRPRLHDALNCYRDGNKFERSDPTTATVVGVTDDQVQTHGGEEHG